MTSQSFPNFRNSPSFSWCFCSHPPCPLLCPLALQLPVLVLSLIPCTLFWFLLTSSFCSFLKPQCLLASGLTLCLTLMGFCWHSLTPSVIIQSLGHFWWLSVAQTYTPGPIGWLQVSWYTPYWPLENGVSVADFFHWWGLWIWQEFRVSWTVQYKNWFDILLNYPKFTNLMLGSCNYSDRSSILR